MTRYIFEISPHPCLRPACRQAGNPIASPLCLRLRHSLRGEREGVEIFMHGNFYALTKDVIFEILDLFFIH